MGLLRQGGRRPQALGLGRPLSPPLAKGLPAAFLWLLGLQLGYCGCSGDIRRPGGRLATSRADPNMTGVSGHRDGLVTLHSREQASCRARWNPGLWELVPQGHQSGPLGSPGRGERATVRSCWTPCFPWSHEEPSPDPGFRPRPEARRGCRVAVPVRDADGRSSGRCLTVRLGVWPPPRGTPGLPRAGTPTSAEPGSSRR